MSSSNPDNTLTSAEVEHLNKLEAIVQRGLDTDLELANALADLSDATLYRATHPTFEAYLRDRWGIRHSPDCQLSQAAELGTEPPPGDQPGESTPEPCPTLGPLGELGSRRAACAAGLAANPFNRRDRGRCAQPRDSRRRP